MAGDGTLFQRKQDGKWYYIISKGWDPNLRKGKGGYKQEWIDLETTDSKEAKKKRDIILGQIKSDKYHSPAKVTLNELLARWIKHCEDKGLKRRTIEEYKKLIDKHIKDCLGKELLPKIKPKNIRELIESNKSQYVRKKLYIVFNSVYKLGMADDDLDIPENPCSRITPPIIKKTKHQTWKLSEIKIFLEHSRFLREYGIYLCCLTTGMRIGEVLGLRWKDIDIKKRTITIRQTLEEKAKGCPEPVFGTPKTDASKAPIMMTDILAAEFERVREQQKTERRKAGKIYKNYDLIFTSFVGKPVHLENLRNKYFNPAIKAAGVSKIRIHDMRHSAATLLLSLGIPLDIIQRYLRHAQRDTTEIYAHNDDIELLRDATDKINKALS